MIRSSINRSVDGLYLSTVFVEYRNRWYQGMRWYQSMLEIEVKEIEDRDIYTSSGPLTNR